MREDVLRGSLEFAVGGERVRVQLEAPAGAVRPAAILPVFRVLSDAIEGVAVRQVEAGGKRVSCCAGCGACCRQLVPISEIEARFLSGLVAGLPEAERAAVLGRFATAQERLAEAGMLERLRDPAGVAEAERPELGITYFRLGIACPFLVDERCSTHEDRPLVCREYLVTSPAEHCVDLRTDWVERVPFPSRISGALARFGDTDRPGRTTWVPLVLALEWDERFPDDLPSKTGPEWVSELLGMLGGGE